MCRLTSLHRTHIGYLEMGKRLPRADNLIKLASALAVAVDELLRGAHRRIQPIGEFVQGAAKRLDRLGQKAGLFGPDRIGCFSDSILRELELDLRRRSSELQPGF